MPMTHLNALAGSFGLGQVVKPGIAFELERHTVGKRKRDWVPQLEHSSGVG